MTNWADITDEQALAMLQKLVENLTDDELLDTYSADLEKRYQNATGTLIDQIFQKDMTDPQELLDYMKNNGPILL